jgi:hypothetical protein
MRERRCNRRSVPNNLLIVDSLQTRRPASTHKLRLSGLAGGHDRDLAAVDAASLRSDDRCTTAWRGVARQARKPAAGKARCVNRETRGNLAGGRSGRLVCAGRDCRSTKMWPVALPSSVQNFYNDGSVRCEDGAGQPQAVSGSISVKTSSSLASKAKIVATSLNSSSQHSPAIRLK